MHKNPTTGRYEDDFKRKAYGPDGRDFRLHVSYGVTTKVEAEPLAAGVKRLVDGKHFDVIDLLRSGDVTARQVADHIAEDKPIGLLRALAPAPAPTEAPWPSVRAAADAALAWMDENPNRADATRDTASARYNRFCAFLDGRRDLVPLGAETPLDAVPTAVVEAYQRALLASGAERNTVIAYVAQVGTLYRWQLAREKRDAGEAKRVPRMLHVPVDPETTAKGRTRRERFLAEEEAERLFEACPDPLLCPVAMGPFAGLRVEEMLHLRPSFDIDLEHTLIIIQPQPGWTPKDKERRVIPIAPPLLPLLERHLAAYASDEWLMPSPIRTDQPLSKHGFTKYFARVVRDAELVYGRKPKVGVVYHTLRHTFASWLIMRGVDLYTVAQLLGNSLKMVEETYGHLAPDFRQRALDRLEGAVKMPTRLAALDSESAATATTTTDGSDA